MKKIGLLMIALLVFAQAEFKRGANDLTVIDTETKLEWQDSYIDNNNTIPRTYWSGAVSYCNNLTLDGKSDWRLPNINELKTIIIDTQYSPSINKNFNKVASSNYFSSTTAYRTDAYGRHYVWGINFNNSFTTIIFLYGSSDSSYSYVRCVRDYNSQPDL